MPLNVAQKVMLAITKKERGSKFQWVAVPKMEDIICSLAFEVVPYGHVGNTLKPRP